MENKKGNVIVHFGEAIFFFTIYLYMLWCHNYWK